MLLGIKFMVILSSWNQTFVASPKHIDVFWLVCQKFVIDSLGKTCCSANASIMLEGNEVYQYVHILSSFLFLLLL